MTDPQIPSRRVVLVTGASSGIGRAVATAFAAAGHVVVGTSRHAATAEPLSGVRLVDLDVTSPESVDAVVADLVERDGHIDVLVNNAGIGALGAAEESTVDQDRDLFELNVFGVMRMTKAVLPHMRRRGSGRIVTVSSVLGLIPAPFMASYAASKHAIEGWSESVDHETRQYGVRVLLVEPSWTATGFESRSLGPDNPLADYTAQRRTAEEIVTAAVRSGDRPDVVAAAVLTAALSPRPALRSTAGAAGRVAVLRRLVPARAFDRQIRKINRLPA